MWNYQQPPTPRLSRSSSAGAELVRRKSSGMSEKKHISCRSPSHIMTAVPRLPKLWESYGQDNCLSRAAIKARPFILGVDQLHDPRRFVGSCVYRRRLADILVLLNAAANRTCLRSRPGFRFAGRCLCLLRQRAVVADGNAMSNTRHRPELKSI